MGWATDLPTRQPGHTVEAVADRPDAERVSQQALDHLRLSATYLARTAAVPKDLALEIAAANDRLNSFAALGGTFSAARTSEPTPRPAEQRES